MKALEQQQTHRRITQVDESNDFSIPPHLFISNKDIFDILLKRTRKEIYQQHKILSRIQWMGNK